MINEEILKKAIEKAIRNKYKPNGILGAVLRGEIGIGLDPNIYKHLMKGNLYYIYIFSHDFAKTFWGKEFVEVGWKQPFHYQIAWQYHLKQMVLEKEPLKYLEKFLKKEQK